MSKLIDMLGRRIGKLLVVERSVARSKWKCVCECGRVTYVTGSDLRKPVRSCGCLISETTSLRNTKHGLSQDHKRAFNAWNAAVQRCHNSNNPKYENWGGRGIKVCRRWRFSFENFLLDMGDPPPKMELDRKNNDKGYSPKNCRWVTRRTNINNRRTSKWLSFRGQRRTLKDWAKIIGISSQALRFRLTHMTVKEALLTPKVSRSKRRPAGGDLTTN